MISLTILFFMVIIIGLITFVQRAILLYQLPKFMNNAYIKRGMDAVPAAMLVALVIPFTLFLNKDLVLWRPEVVAMILAIPFIYLSKKYGYAIIIASILYYVIKYFFTL